MFLKTFFMLWEIYDLSTFIKTLIKPTPLLQKSCITPPTPHATISLPIPSTPLLVHHTEHAYCHSSCRWLLSSCPWTYRCGPRTRGGWPSRPWSWRLPPGGGSPRPGGRGRGRPTPSCRGVTQHRPLVEETRNGGLMFNPLNVTGANMYQVLMLTVNHGIERIKAILLTSAFVPAYEVANILRNFQTSYIPIPVVTYQAAGFQTLKCSEK